MKLDKRIENVMNSEPHPMNQAQAIAKLAHFVRTELAAQAAEILTAVSNRPETESALTTFVRLEKMLRGRATPVPPLVFDDASGE